MKNLLLVGAGQLGSRYLQGLVALDQPFSLKVVDPSEVSLNAASDRLAQVPMMCEHLVEFTTSLSDVPENLDLAFVVTPAHCRSRLVSDLISCHEVKNWILEKVLAQSCDQLDQIQKSLGSAQAWVNTPRRLMAWHQEIRSQLLPNGPVPLQVRVNGGTWDLACNAIHFIDLVAWWTQAPVQSVDTSGLINWVQSKRAGFHEVFGKVRIFYSDGSELELCSDFGNEPIQITVSTPQGEWRIEESSGICTGPTSQQVNGQLSFQSALTAPMVKQILQEGRSDLPTLAESTAQHRPLLTALLTHWNQRQGCQDLVVPIT